MALLIVPFLALAAIGLTLSVVAHVCALLGVPQPLGEATWGLHVGIFVVWVPSLLASNQMVRGTRRADFWRVALRGCPTWMRWMMMAFFCYAFLNFVFSFATAHAGKQPAGDPAPPAVVRGFSGHWMVFYSAAFAMLYSRLNVSLRGEGKGPDEKPGEVPREEVEANPGMWDREIDA